MTQDWTPQDVAAAIRAELPTRMVSRDLADDGAPAFSHALESYLDDDGQRMISDEQMICTHPTLKDSRSAYTDCPTCDGSGLRNVTRHTYRRPMKAAMKKLRSTPVPKGRPRLDAVIWALAVNDGDVEAAIAGLRTVSAFMWHPVKSRRWVSHALYQLRLVYREDVPARIVGKSSSQLDAEAEKAA